MKGRISIEFTHFSLHLFTIQLRKFHGVGKEENSIENYSFLCELINTRLQSTIHGFTELSFCDSLNKLFLKDF